MFTVLTDISRTSFDWATMIHELPDTCAFRKGKLICVKDFGTVLIDPQFLPKDWRDMSLPQPGAPLFCAPSTWTNISQVMKALGAFKSTTQARKAGWDFEIPLGCSSHVVKIAKMRGEIWIHRGGIKDE